MSGGVEREAALSGVLGGIQSWEGLVKGRSRANRRSVSLQVLEAVNHKLSRHERRGQSHSSKSGKRVANENKAGPIASNQRMWGHTMLIEQASVQEGTGRGRGEKPRSPQIRAFEWTGTEWEYNRGSGHMGKGGRRGQL